MAQPRHDAPIADTRMRLRVTPRARLVGALGLVAALRLGIGWAPGAERTMAPDHFQRGVALGLFASDPAFDYDGLLGELADLGATDVELVVPWYQASLGATAIGPRAGSSPSRATVARTIEEAHRRGLRVLLFPIVELAVPLPSEWRGRIEAGDASHQAAWWSSYRAFVLDMAAIADERHAERLSVGSELLLLEGDRARWGALIADARRVFAGRLVYSANWDHFEAVRFWDLVDEIGVTAYFELSRARSPSTIELTEAWTLRSRELDRYSRSIHRPLIVTEVGYPSVDEGAARPWDHASEAPIDVEQQARCYAAFTATAGRAPFLDGVYFWNWFGVGGANDRGYTPRGKPAARILRGYLRAHH